MEVHHFSEVQAQCIKPLYHVSINGQSDKIWTCVNLILDITLRLELKSLLWVFFVKLCGANQADNQTIETDWIELFTFWLPEVDSNYWSQMARDLQSLLVDRLSIWQWNQPSVRIALTVWNTKLQISWSRYCPNLASNGALNGSRNRIFSFGPRIKIWTWISNSVLH